MDLNHFNITLVLLCAAGKQLNVDALNWFHIKDIYHRDLYVTPHPTTNWTSRADREQWVTSTTEIKRIHIQVLFSRLLWTENLSAGTRKRKSNVYPRSISVSLILKHHIDSKVISVCFYTLFEFFPERPISDQAESAKRQRLVILLNITAAECSLVPIRAN